MKRIILMFILICTVSPMTYAGDAYEKYVGFWEKQEKRSDYAHDYVVEIRKKGETFVCLPFVLHEDRMLILSKDDGQLVLENRKRIAFGDNKDEILFMDSSYKRINPERVEQIKIEMQQEKEAAASLREQCDKIVRAAMDEQSALLKQKDLNFSQRRELDKAIEEKHKKIYEEKGCNLNRWPLQF